MLTNLFYNQDVILATVKNEEIVELRHSESLFVKRQLRTLGELKFSSNIYQKKIQYRGTNNSLELDQFCKAIFVVGEKANYYVSNSNRVADFDDIEYLKSEINDMINFINNKKSDILKGKISYDVFSEIELGEFFQLLRYLVHNIGGNTFHDKSLNISSSVDHRVAKTFATSRNDNNQYIIISKENNGRQQLSAKELKEKLNYFGFEWYEDSNFEIMQQDAISPSDIIGIFDIKKKILVINKFLVETICIKNFNLSKQDIPIDQTDFHQLNRLLGNNGYVEFVENNVVGRDFYN